MKMHQNIASLTQLLALMGIEFRDAYVFPTSPARGVKLKVGEYTVYLRVEKSGLVQILRYNAKPPKRAPTA